MESWFNIKEADWRDLAKALLLGTLIAGALAAIWVLARQFRTRRDPIVEAWEELCAKLDKCGIPRIASRGAG